MLIKTPLTGEVKYFKLLISKCDSLYFVVVENVYKNREPVPHMKAIYLITPTKKVSVLSKIQWIRLLCFAFFKS